MNSIVKSKALREVLVFAALLGGTLLLSQFIAEPAFATSLISPSDNPSAISAATGGESDAKSLIQTMLNFVLGFLGFAATVMVIYGGVLYVTSAGNDESVGKAKKIIMYAILGIVIILISFALVNTVLTGLGGGGGVATTT